MCARLFRNTYIAEILLVLLLLVPLTACGTQNRSSVSSTSTPSPNNSSSSSSNQSDIFSLNKTGISIDKANLHIDASSGMQCPIGDTFKGTPDNPGLLVGPTGANELVLATNRVTYDRNEIKQIKDYVTGNSAQIPNTLRFVLGGPIDTSIKVTISSEFDGFRYDCGINLNLTNAGQNLIQIPSVGAKLTGNTQPNNYQYRLIDYCSFFEACGSGGSSLACDQYYATIKLGIGSTNTIFPAIPVAGGGSSCGELTLNPGDTKILSVYFYSPSNLIYSVVPQLLLDTSSGKNTLSLTELTSTLAFAKGSQFTCYSLQGDTFVKETTQPSSSDCI